MRSAVRVRDFPPLKKESSRLFFCFGFLLSEIFFHHRFCEVFSNFLTPCFCLKTEFTKFGKIDLYFEKIPLRRGHIPRLRACRAGRYRVSARTFRSAWYITGKQRGTLLRELKISVGWGFYPRLIVKLGMVCANEAVHFGENLEPRRSGIARLNVCT